MVTIVVITAGCTTPSDMQEEEEKLTLTLSNPSVEPRDTGTTTVYDCSMFIQKITPRDMTVKWSELSIVIKSHDGSVLISKTTPSEDTGSYSETVEVWYSDEAGDRENADTGDELVISGMSKQDYQGAQVEVVRKGDRVASVILPTNFP
jgi:hypothetical protein